WKLCTPETTYADLRPGTCNDFSKKLSLEDFLAKLVALTACTGSGKIVQLLGKGITEIEKGIKVSSWKQLLVLIHG
ncbi:Hypothetical predicted protein, partial [Prunus dulcis]